LIQRLLTWVTGNATRSVQLGAAGTDAEGQCLTDLLATQARWQPDAVAVVDGDEELTFRDLVERAEEMGRYLRHMGVRPDDPVGLFVDPSLDLMSGAWGILFAGAGYLPLSPEYPDDRVRFMIEQSRTRVIVCGENLRAKLAALAPPGVRVVTPGDAAAYALAHPAAFGLRAEVGPHPRNLAYVIYTSGSTGDPKGVMIEHRSIVNQMLWLRDEYEIGPRTVILQKTQISFDAAQWEILAVANGSRVVMGTLGVYRDPAGLIELIVRHRVTALQCVPTVLQALVDTEAFHRCATLTQVFSGGEALTRRLALAILEALPNCQVVNLYGPTECTINSSAFTVDPATVAAGPTTISIGAPVRNTQYYVLDDARRPVEVGEVGELYIGGHQLARGYLHRPDLTSERFSDDPLCPGPDRMLYRTGDLVHLNPDGTVQFVGRADNQVKVRGHRIELDEVRVKVELHAWVKRAAVVVHQDERTGTKNLVAFAELNPREAALMDQGAHGDHHQSKRSKAQVRAQLANLGCRDPEELAGRHDVELPGRTTTAAQEERVFARKTYRFYDGGAVCKADLLQLLAEPEPPAGATSRGLDHLSPDEFGEILRYFGQFHSGERLLPKYGYASPGALYATQMYLEIDGVRGLAPGCYYYHPVHHHLVLIRAKAGQAGPRVKVHFVGKKRAIEPIYKLNIQEVLEIEAGHMVGLFEAVLPGYGLGIRAAEYEPAAKNRLDCADDDYYLGAFDLVPHAEEPADEPMDVYVQAHPGKIEDLPAGLYRHTAAGLERVSDEVVRRNQVIAINQGAYDRASFGITLVSRTGEAWRSYVELGRKLQLLQMNDMGLGFMSSGYSSKSGDDLPSAKRVDTILRGLGLPTGPSYFFVGGRVSDDQRASRGMKEDAVHMKGPAEMIKDDLARCLPAYMVPARVVILDTLPLTANRKVDVRALSAVRVEQADRPFLTPRTPVEERLCELWAAELKAEAVSVTDDFFLEGADSLQAVSLATRISQAFGREVPVQALFEAPTVEKLAALLDAGGPCSRLVLLQPNGMKPPVYCWPGLGGYPMNLRLLAARLGTDQPFVGVQAHGINPGEVSYGTLREMAAADVRLIRERQPAGPYTLWGYSFGARVAFEAAYQLEQAGEIVDHLFLIAPGSPRVSGKAAAVPSGPSYADPEYLTILFSVFTRTIAGPVLDECLTTVTNEDSFVRFICDRKKTLDTAMVRRIAQIVAQTYGLRPTPRELATRQLACPVTVFRAAGDNDSFIEVADATAVPTVIALDVDHYGLLQDPGVDELVAMIRHRTRSSRRSRPRPSPVSQPAATS
jgi:amino acid adenylation domain-containing protein